MASSIAGENDKKQSNGIKPNDNVDPEFKRWMDSVLTMLGCIREDGIEACSISIVPEHLRESNKEAYMPKVVSIGPLYRRTKRELLYMKEIKWLYMLSLLHRVDGQKKPEEHLKRCSKAMHELDELFRASYVDDLKLFDRYDLAKIMLLDGCFLLELLISNNEGILKNKLECSLKLPVPTAEIAKKEEVLADLIVLENQIPLYTLHKLSTILFPDDFKKEDEGRLVSNLVLSLFGYNINTRYKATHLLELLHSCVTGNLDKQKVENENKPSCNAGDVIINMESKQVEQSITSHGELELKRCATKLQAAGVKIKPRKTQKNAVGFDFNIEFARGKLKIPELHITGTTEVKWRNFIAWEHNKSRTRINSKFSWYALFISGLICCEHDIQLLREKSVIVVDDGGYSGINQDNKKKKKKKKKKNMTNKDLMLLFRNIADGVDGDKVVMDSSFAELFQKLNEHQSTVNPFMDKFKVFWHYFKRFLSSLGYKWKKSYTILKLEYTPTMWKKIGIAYAASLLGLTIAQVVLQANGK